jgi:SAM-dependent methyltransferase
MIMMEQEELAAWFRNVRDVLETAYVANDEPWQQSGMSGPAERWEALRKPIADCIDHSGSFLDIGCANGYLLECCMAWTAERGIHIEPYGLDFSPRLIQLAQQRLLHIADHFFLGNVWEWHPPQQFDFVRTELVYVPGEYEQQYVTLLLQRYVKPDGRLLIANYSEGSPHPERGLLPGSYPTKYILDRLAELGFRVADYKDGKDPANRSHTRVAIIANKGF